MAKFPGFPFAKQTNKKTPRQKIPTLNQIFEV